MSFNKENGKRETLKFVQTLFRAMEDSGRGRKGLVANRRIFGDDEYHIELTQWQRDLIQTFCNSLQGEKQAFRGRR